MIQAAHHCKSHNNSPASDVDNSRTKPKRQLRRLSILELKVYSVILYLSCEPDTQEKPHWPEHISSIYRCRHEFAMSNIDNTLRLVTSAVVEQSLICQMCYLKGWDSLPCRHIALVNALGALIIKDAMCHFWRNFQDLLCPIKQWEGNLSICNFNFRLWVC